MSEAKESFEIGLLTKSENSPVTSKQELHSFIKAAFCLTTVHRWLYGDSEKLHEVGQLCKEAMGKLHAYSTSLAEEEEKGVLAKEIMSLIASVKKHLQVESFPNSDARSYIPDIYKSAVQKPILQGEANFEKILAKHSQHHLSVCEVFKNTCRSHKTTPGEVHTGACVTTLKTETNNIDTVCTTEEAACQRKGAGKMANTQKAESTSERLSGQTRNKCIASDVINISFEEETEPFEIVISDGNSAFGRWQNRSQTTTSENSWCKLSLSSYSSSWEELSCNSSQEPHREGQQQQKGSAEEQCCTTESAEYDQAARLHSLPPRARQPSPRELPRGLVGSPHAPPARRPGQGGCSTTDSELGPRQAPKSRSAWVQPAGGTGGRGEGLSSEHSTATNGVADAESTGTEPEMASEAPVGNWLGKSPAVAGNRSHKMVAVDPQAETVDDTEFGDLVNNYPTAAGPHLPAPGAPTALPSGGKMSKGNYFDCATTEEEEEKPQDRVSSQRPSLSPWHNSAQKPKCSPEGPFLNPRGDGLAFTPGRTKEEVLDARILRDDDYVQLLAGVEHNWLVQRLTPTGIFKPKQLHKAYCKFPHSNKHFHAVIATPTENSRFNIMF